MKIVVIGGTGLIGSKLVNKLREHGHEAVAASPNSGVNTVTGEGLAEVLKGAAVVVDVSNSPDWEDAAVLSSSKHQPVTSTPTKRPQGSDITLRYRLWEQTGCPKAVTSGARLLRRN